MLGVEHLLLILTDTIYSSFSNTDLDYQLRQRDITHLIFAGLTTNTCVETTARHARELCVTPKYHEWKL